MANFEIHGPFSLDFENRKGGRTLVFDSFWKKESEASYLSDKCGCYVFAIRQGRALIPVSMIGIMEPPMIGVMAPV
jgi:hypothetical protein